MEYKTSKSCVSRTRMAPSSAAMLEKYLILWLSNPACMELRLVGRRLEGGPHFVSHGGTVANSADCQTCI